MKTLAVFAASALALTGCGFLGGAHHAPLPQHHGAYAPGPVYGGAPHGHALPGAAHHAQAPVPVSNACALGGPCPSGGYATVGHQPGAHAYGTQAGGYGPHALRGARGPLARQGFAYATLGGTSYDVDDDLYGIQARLGYQSANIIGAELEGSFGVSDQEELIGTTPVDFEVESQFAGFATANLPVAGGLALRGRAGYHFTEAKVSNAELNISERSTLDGFAWGAGAELAVAPRSALRLDYTRYHNGSNGDALDSLALAYAHRF